jgi:hypothetical protein
VNAPTDDNQKDPPAAESPGGVAEDKRAAARRRFLKMGAGGSSAMVMTIVHKRAFGNVTIKKGAIASACVSLQGVPDIKGMHQKKALQLSAMGTPKGMICRPRPVNNTCSATSMSPYYNEEGKRVYTVTSKMLDDGCGKLDDTIHFQRDYRLYQQGYCPVKYDANGDLTYDTAAVYYVKDKCKDGAIDSKTGAVCVRIGKDTFWKHTCG